MYSFQTGAGGRKTKQRIRLLSIIIFILAVALVGVTFAYLQSRGMSQSIGDALLSRAVSEATEAQSAVYRLTQSSGTNTMTLLANVRGHIYALQCLNTLTSNLYGAGVVLIDGDLLTACTGTLDQCEARLQAGSVLTDLFTTLRDQVDVVASSFAALE